MTNEAWQNALPVYWEMAFGWFLEMKQLLKHFDGKDVIIPIDIDWLIR